MMFATGHHGGHDRRPDEKELIHAELIIDRAPRSRHDPLHRAAESAIPDGDQGSGSVRSGTTGQGSNSVNVRLFNERVILTLLRRLGQASKADLARHAGLTNNTAGVIVHELEAQGLIRAEGKRTGARGQPATLLSLDRDGAYSIGVRVGRRSVDTLLVNLAGEILDQRRHEGGFPLPAEALAMVLEDVSVMRRALPAGRAQRLAGIGLALPYNMGSWPRELDIPAEAARAWENYDLARELAALTGLSVFAENDGNAATIAELFQGHGRELDDFVYLFIGAAIGGGVVIHGDCHRGVTGNGGDMGLMPVPGSRLATAPAPNRRLDILLTRASLNSLIRHFRGSGVAVEAASELEAAMRERRDLLAEWLDDCADALAGPVLAAICVLDVPAVIMDGDLPRAVLLDLIRRLEKVLSEAVPEARQPPRLLIGSIGRQAAAIGAAILPLHVNYSASPGVLLGQEPEAPGSQGEWARGRQ
jgi:predicted NBD/HSP70 family sugar kinase